MFKFVRELLYFIGEKLMPDAVRRRMMSCRQATEILIYPENQNWRSRLRMKMHIIMCRLCWRFQEQIKLLDRSLKDRYEQTHAQSSYNNQINKLTQNTIDEYSRETPPTDTSTD
jgi:hypothetical protein